MNNVQTLIMAAVNRAPFTVFEQMPELELSLAIDEFKSWQKSEMAPVTMGVN